MDNNIKRHTYEGILISKDNIIIDVDKDIIELTGYTEAELMGKTLEETSKIFRIDSQVNLLHMKDKATIFLFTKELLPIEGKISCSTNEEKDQKIFKFIRDYTNLTQEKYDLLEIQSTTQGIGVSIFTYPDLVLINGNQNFFNFFDTPFNIRKNSIGKSLVKIMPSYLSFGYKDIKNHIDNLGTPYYMEEKCVKINNNEKEYWNISVVPMFVQSKMPYVILSLRDVTDKVLNQKMLKQRNKQLEAIINNISDEIIIFDKNGDIIQSNRGLEKNFVFDNPSITNLNDITKNAVILDKNNRFIQDGDFPFQRVARGQVVSEYEMKIESVSGILHKEVSGSPIYDREGDFSGGVMVYKDIENRLALEEARLIKIQNELLSKVVKALDLEFIRCSYPDFKILSINGRSFADLRDKIYGTNPWKCPIGENYFDIYPVNEEQKRRDLHYNLILKKKTSFIDYDAHIVDGDQRFFKTIIQSIIGLNNKIVELIFIAIDITDEVKARNKVEETLEMQNQMFSTISHELKTPLSVIFSASQLIELDLMNQANSINKSDIRKNIDIIKQNCYRFTKLINNIIDLSRMESGFYQLKLSNKNIVEIVEDIVDSVRPYVKNKELNIIFDTEVEERLISIDVDKLERIMLNLISNAVKFSPKDANIYVDIIDKVDCVLIQVRDSGVGIKKEYLSTIFDKYKKVDNSLARNAEGSGIGLYLVKTIVELMGGEIRVESEPGKGSLFTVSLPVKLVDESEVINTIAHPDNKKEQIYIEFSDIYSKY